MATINSFEKKSWTIWNIKDKLIKTFRNNSSVLDECALTNIRRIYYLSIIAVPLRLVNILQFTINKPYDEPVYETWSQGIILSHSILLILMLGFLLISHKLKNRNEPTKSMFILQYIVVLVIMTSGVAIVTIDQLVTSNITPILLTSVVSGLVFLIRPLASLIIYASSYIAYYNLIGLTISNQELLLSNRVNGVTAIGFGFFLSFIIWQYNYTNIVQKRKIEIQQKQLEQMAYFDPLTDLPNRRLLEKLIKQEYAAMQRYGYDTSIIILDIDDFKKINDSYGHLVGDNVLRQLAELLRNNVRVTDSVFRFGGEEFIILMPNTTVDGCYDFAERLRKIIRENRFTIGSNSLRITCSFGVSPLSAINKEHLEDYYNLADKALYVAKQSGKNKVEILSETRKTESM